MEEKRPKIGASRQPITALIENNSTNHKSPLNLQTIFLKVSSDWIFSRCKVRGLHLDFVVDCHFGDSDDHRSGRHRRHALPKVAHAKWRSADLSNELQKWRRNVFGCLCPHLQHLRRTGDTCSYPTRRASGRILTRFHKPFSHAIFARASSTLDI